MIGSRGMGAILPSKQPKRMAAGGLYANINARRKAGLPPKKPGQEGYPTAKAFKQSAKTARK